MTRTSKQAERRARCPRKRKAPAVKTGPKEDNLPQGFKLHDNAAEGSFAEMAFIPKVK